MNLGGVESDMFCVMNAKIASMHGEKQNMTLMSVVWAQATISALGSSVILLIYLIYDNLQSCVTTVMPW